MTKGRSLALTRANPISAKKNLIKLPVKILTSNRDIIIEKELFETVIYIVCLLMHFAK